MQALYDLFPENQEHYDYISGRTDSPRPNARLNQELERKTSRLLQFQERVGELSQENSVLENQKADLVGCINDVRRQLDIVKEDLNISRSFAPDEGTINNQDAVIADFRQLGRQTSAMIMRIVALLPSNILNSPLLRKSTSPDLHQISPFLDLIFQRHSSLRVELISTYILHYKLRAQMMKTVFGDFVYGMQSDERELLETIHRSVLVNETQEKSARWRAITYLHLKPDLKLYEKVAKDSLDEVGTLLHRLTGHKLDNRHLQSQCGQQMKELFECAARFMTMLQTSCTSMNITAFLPTELDFDPVSMSAHDSAKGTTNSRCVLPIGIGLLKTWTVMENGALRQRSEYLQQGSVICENWHPKNIAK